MAEPTLIPTAVAEVVELVRNVALVAIPFVLWAASRANEYRRATLDLIRNLETGGEIVDRLERLYQYRMYQEAIDAGAQPTCTNPYAQFPQQFRFDSVIVLNYFEAACVEILKGAVDEDMMFESTRNTIIGAADSVLGRYSRDIGNLQATGYNNLVTVAKRWRERVERYNLLGATHIPDR